MTLSSVIAAYVDLNQSMGMRFQVDTGLLRAFQRHTGDIDLAAITPDLICAFLQPRTYVTSTWLMKHRALRRLFQYAITRGLTLQSPVPTVIPRVPETFVPHIYTDQELRRLLAGVDENQAEVRCTISARTFQAALLLLYGAGLRLGELLALRRDDVDLDRSLILIRESKFYKSRQLPVGPRLTQILAEVAPANRPSMAAFFVNRRGHPIPLHTIWWNFNKLRTAVGVRGRLHDLRHTFAVHRLLAWYREGADVQRHLPHLSTYLGHARIACTQRYLTMIPALLEQASQRFETYARPEVQHV
jgi:integrase